MPERSNGLPVGRWRSSSTPAATTSGTAATLNSTEKLLNPTAVPPNAVRHSLSSE
jgi:hypothetical protein